MPDASFNEFVLDQLRDLNDVRTRAMFGAHGLYCGEQFFGILDEGRVYFKTDAASAPDYTARGMAPFTYHSRGKTVALGFHEVPPEILEQPHELVLWARRALALATTKAVPKPKRPRRKA